MRRGALRAEDEGRGPISNERATIATIAEEAGVSVPTVSKVLNGRADVAEATRVRIEELIQHHGYRRRRVAPATNAPMVDLVFHRLGSPWAMELIRGVEDVAREAGVEVVLSEAGEGRIPRTEWLESVLKRRPLGAIMVFSDLEASQRRQLEARNIPFVVVDPVGEEVDDVPSIGSANFNGGMVATRHLLGLGHRRIAVIGSAQDVPCSTARIAGYRAALEAHGVPVDPRFIRHGNFSVDGGHRHGLDLLQLADRPTAIFAGSDLQALGVYKAARDLSLHVPQDVSVVGYDNIDAAVWVGPTLTTVEQPLMEMAQQATRLVLALSRGERPSSTRMDLANTLVVRESTARPPSDA
ncbi:LacI family DNA-binding transcriptional regulator [Cellulomonas bogoriensis]|uniref:LacI family DNA-binding transcriptional regulator n=1 Tax=Cellulomonas bogoriensis TaxID=301388 RepID=UPI000ACAC241|nr:LacI family DNA-binding transcriptional regulator [Cellulomonas bogoriensis]